MKNNNLLINLKDYHYPTVSRLDDFIRTLSRSNEKGATPSLYRSMLISKEVLIRDIDNLKRKNTIIAMAFTFLSVIAILVMIDNFHHSSALQIQPIQLRAFIDLVIFGMPAIACGAVVVSLIFLVRALSIAQFKRDLSIKASSVVDLSALSDFLSTHSALHSKFNEIKFDGEILAIHISYLSYLEQQAAIIEHQEAARFQRMSNTMAENKILASAKKMCNE